MIGEAIALLNAMFQIHEPFKSHD